MWYCNDTIINSVEQMPEGTVGFVYLITNLDTNHKYIGRKILNFTRKAKISKREQELTNNRRKKTKTISTESNWLGYTGSCKELNEDIKGGAHIKKEILKFCFSKRNLNYEETKQLFLNNVLEDEQYYNNNIMLRFYTGKID